MTSLKVDTQCFFELAAVVDVEKHEQKYGRMVAGLKIRVPWCGDDRCRWLWCIYYGLFGVVLDVAGGFLRLNQILLKWKQILGLKVKFHRCLHGVIKGGVCSGFWHARHMIMKVSVCSFHANWIVEEHEYHMEICGD